WSGADNPQLTRYIADISTDNFATLVQSSITPNTSAVFTGLTPNALYYARARAQNHNGIDTDFTAAVDTVTASAAPLNTSVPFTNLSANTFTFNWKSGGNSAGTNYGPEISTDNFVTLYSSLTTTSLNADFSGLLVNTTYYARVSAIGSGGLASPYSSPVVSTVTLVLTPVTATPPFKDVFISSFTFLWENGGNPNGTLYTAEISTDGFVSVSSAIQTIATSANFSALTVNMVYQARTKAINFLGVDGPYSSPIRSTSTLATIPSNVSQPFSAVSASTLTFTWADGGNPGGTSYTVEISSTNFAQGTAISSATTLALSQTFSGLLPNTTYYGRVKAVNMNNVPSAYSPAVSVVTLPLAPVTASPPFSGVESSGLVLSWTANGNPQNTTYVAEISRDNFVTTPLSSTTLNTQATLTDLIPNTTYTARVKAVNFAGNSGPYSSPIVSTATLAVPPQSAVSSFTLTNDGLIVHWSAGGNPSGTLYEAEVSTRSDFTPLRSSSSVTSLSESFALTANTTYYARVRALNHNGIRTADLNLGSDITYAATPDVLASTTPGSVSVTTFSFTNTVSTGVGGILYYRFVWDKNATHAWNNQESSWTALNVLTTTATGNGHWYLHLRSYNFNNIGYKTADIGSFDIDINTVTAPGQPVPVPGAFTADSGITWNWATAIAFGDTAISSYVVCLGTAPTDVNVIVATVTPTNFTLDPADNGKTYYIKVKAIDEGGKSSPYSEVSNPGVLVDRTPPEQVGNVQADRKFSYDGTIVFSWSVAADSESGIKNYLLDLGTSLNGNDIVNAKNVGIETSYQAIGLPSGKSIFARVRAENNAGGTGNYSDSSPAIPVWTLNQAPPMVHAYNWPNPFNPMSGPAQIGFFLNAPAKVTIKLFTLENFSKHM
ncbi:MAG: fibronectin type III domain-containing protein, partial [Elusimicrobia bacterium]|nr:fibronectin type III domain-containing protein [Elusimicrobiota bacterium]